jgi:hypothetical protein
MSTYDYVLRINGGTLGTVTLTSSPWAIRDYHPMTPGLSDPLVAESVSARVMDGSVANNLDEIRLLQRIFLQAAMAQSTRIDKVYLEFVQTSGESTWRSEIMSGFVDILDTSLGRSSWESNTQLVDIYWNRVPFWEGPETQVPLSNGNGTNNTSGLTVFNHSDEGGSSPNKHENWISIAASDVTGDLPGATRLEITNTYSGRPLDLLWIGQNWTDPDNLGHILEAEDSTLGTKISNASCSGGYYRRAVVNTYEWNLYQFSLAGDFFNACKGQYYKMLFRFAAGPPTNMQLRIKLNWGSTTIWQSGLVAPDDQWGTAIRDMFTVRLPPWLPGLTGITPLTMTISGLATTGAGGWNLDLDFIQFTPVDGYRWIDNLAPAPQNSRIIDDGINHFTYIDDGTTNKGPAAETIGNPIMLFPGKKQRLYFLMHADLADTAEIDRTISIKFYYRPRRRTL